MDRSSSSLMTTYWSGATSIPLTISSDGTSSVHASHHFLYRIGESLSLCKSRVLSGFCSIAELSFMVMFTSPNAIDPFHNDCLLYTSDAADEEDSVDLGGRRIIKKKKEKNTK